jgi:predicted 3-demethylubiquinone-9 3-methyltransferase (glyoxalase superfamily)
MATISHMLWFNDHAEEAANLYLSIFTGGEVTSVSRNPDGSAVIVNFDLLNQSYIALNGGPAFQFTEAFSIFVICDGQSEVDEYWDAFILSGGTEGNCGWLKDKFGLSWQIIPKQLSESLSNPDPVKAQRAHEAMMKMKKIIISELTEAGA